MDDVTYTGDITYAGDINTYRDNITYACDVTYRSDATYATFYDCFELNTVSVLPLSLTYGNILGGSLSSSLVY